MMPKRRHAEKGDATFLCELSMRQLNLYESCKNLHHLPRDLEDVILILSHAFNTHFNYPIKSLNSETFFMRIVTSNEFLHCTTHDNKKN